MKIILTRCSFRSIFSFFVLFVGLIALPVLLFSMLGTVPNTVSAAQTSTCKDWGLSFRKPLEQPIGNASVSELLPYNTYYMGSNTDSTIYLTFDCGFENGNTSAMLDVLKKHEVPATFFVVGHYLESAPELVLRMVAEGHTVANHTYHHPDMSAIAEESAFCRELELLEKKYMEITGEKMTLYYRPPQGKYSPKNLETAKKLGYQTFFWSLAYVDWDQNHQPSPESAIKKLTERIHPGAVVLLHNTSSTNASILDTLLSEWKRMGYQIRPLADLVKSFQTQ